MQTEQGDDRNVVAAAAATAGIVVVETEGSRWELWETEHLYRRSPRTETSREDPAWGGPEAGPLQDHVWHPFTHWTVEPDWATPRLRIESPDDLAISAPSPSLPVGSAHECTRCASDRETADATTSPEGEAARKQL